MNLLLIAIAVLFVCMCFAVSEWRKWRAERTAPRERLAPLRYEKSHLPPYPVDLITEMHVPHGILDEAGVPYNDATALYPATYQPTTIAQYALVQWNAYLRTGDEAHKQAFMAQAKWLVEHEVSLPGGASGWPISFPLPDYFASGPWLSSLTQGNAISVLVRAYQLTGNEDFLICAHRAVYTFELNIENGGVSTTLGEDRLFFEEVAVHPPAHILNGFIFGLFGLYDFQASITTEDEQVTSLILRSHATMHAIIDTFDRGYWSQYDLLKKHMASYYYHDLHVLLLKALALHFGCQRCATVAARWEKYQHGFYLLRYCIVSRITRYHKAASRAIHSQKLFFRLYQREATEV